LIELFLHLISIINS